MPGRYLWVFGRGGGRRLGKGRLVYLLFLCFGGGRTLAYAVFGGGLFCVLCVGVLGVSLWGGVARRMMSVDGRKVVVLRAGGFVVSF